MVQSLFEALDYRQFLQEHFDALRKKRPNYSIRWIASKVGVDPGQLVKILKKQRHLSERLLPVFAQFIGLNEQETEYFYCLVRLNKAKTTADTQYHYERLTQLKEFALPQVKPNQDRFYDEWYHSVIRVLLAMAPFTGDYEALATMVHPAISVEQAKDSVTLLQKLGFIKKDKQGEYHVTDTFITGGGNWRMYAVRKFQQQTIRLSEGSLLNDPPEARDVSSLTISLSAQELSEYKEMIADFRKKILQKCMDSTGDANKVYQLNMQLIPVGALPASAVGGQDESSD
jgi:uncharacterized protein (TIGR02147 family)